MQSTSGHEREIEQSSPILTADLSSGTNVRPNLSPERINLLKDQLFPPFDRVLVFEADVELGRTNWFVHGSCQTWR